MSVVAFEPSREEGHHVEEVGIVDFDGDVAGWEEMNELESSVKEREVTYCTQGTIQPAYLNVGEWVSSPSSEEREERDKRTTRER